MDDPSSLITADDLLGEMRASGQQLAILVDEYGGTAGLVTVHDLVEELVGPLPDSGEESASEVYADGSISLSGQMPVHEANERFGLALPNGEFDTVAGFILDRIGRMAVPGDQVWLDGHRIRVEAVDGKRIRRVRLERTESGGDDESASSSGGSR